MNKTLLIVGGILFIFGSWFAGAYNNLVKVDEEANQAFANVEADLQRRFDLVGNLVETVKGAANFEKDTFTEVTAARSAWASAKTPDEKVAASNQMEGALARLLVTVEAYPELKATQNFSDLQVQLEGTENRIAVARTRYNDAATIANKLMRSFPNNVLLLIFSGFERHTLFEATEGADKAPAVKF